MTENQSTPPIITIESKAYEIITTHNHWAKVIDLETEDVLWINLKNHKVKL